MRMPEKNLGGPAPLNVPMKKGRLCLQNINVNRLKYYNNKRNYTGKPRCVEQRQ